MVSFRLLCTVAPFLLTASALVARHDDHEHVVRSQLPGNWYHKRDHPVYALFKRQSTSIPFGSPGWANQYPAAKPDPAQLPQAWVNALNAAVSAGKIPNIAPAMATGGNPSYGAQNPNSQQICSATYKCRADGDLWDAPQGVVGISFDDGPTSDSPKLYDFLQSQNQKATHFMIGVNVRNNPELFKRAQVQLQDDIAVHTYSHPYMTTLSNMEVLGELGWTMQVIHDASGGMVPRFWRPPFGDADNRIRAIAKEVFGLVTVIWNKDSEDWSISLKRTTLPAVEAEMTTWYKGPKNPGIIPLEHEFGAEPVQIFIDTYPLLKQNGWTATSLAQLFPERFGGPYQTSGGPLPNGVFAGGPAASANSSTPAPTAASPSGAKPVATVTSTVSTTGSPTSGAQQTAGSSQGANSSSSRSLSSSLSWTALFSLLSLSLGFTVSAL